MKFLRIPSICRKQKEAFGSWVDIVKWDQFKLIYITVPKTANTSIKTALSEAAGTLTEEDRIALETDSQAIHRILREKPDVGLSLQDISNYPDYFVFSTVRHPTERFVSFYKDKIVGGGWRKEDEERIFSAYGFSPNDTLGDCLKKVSRFEDTISEIHFRSQYQLLAPKGELLPHAIFRFENLDLMWRVLKSYIANQGFQMPEQLGKKNPSKHSNITIDEFSEKILRQRYARDFEFLGYS